MAPIHIDESAGSDSTGTGVPDQPYQTLGYALLTHGSTDGFLIRKDPNAAYDEPTQSSLKKAKKTAEGLEKKRKKQEEIAEREAREQGEEQEKRQKLLEESKTIVLAEDPALPQAQKVLQNTCYPSLLALILRIP